VEEFWRRYLDAGGKDGAYTAWGFGDTPGMATRLGLLVRDGPKRATASLVSDYPPGGEPMPAAGDLSVIIDGDGQPLCVIETTSVDIRPFSQVDEAFAWDEGEGDRTLRDWKDGHREFFAGLGIALTDDTEMVLERFTLLWPG
jgi:uncharacterized protein YhfF